MIQSAQPFGHYQGVFMLFEFCVKLSYVHAGV